MLEDTVRAYTRYWTDFAGVYAPYFVVVNACLMGKSRMIRELKKKGILVIPVCLRMPPL